MLENYNGNSELTFVWADTGKPMGPSVCLAELESMEPLTGFALASLLTFRSRQGESRELVLPVTKKELQLFADALPPRSSDFPHELVVMVGFGIIKDQAMAELNLQATPLKDWRGKSQIALIKQGLWEDRRVGKNFVATTRAIRQRMVVAVKLALGS